MENDTHSFVIRIWHETVDGEGNIVDWRGSIDHVGSGNRLYFYDLEGIARFIREQLGLGSRRPRRWMRWLMGWITNGNL